MKRGGASDLAIEYPELFKAFRFLVEVENSGVTSAAFAQFSGVKMEVQRIQARSGNDSRGVMISVPVGTSFAPVTFSKGVIGDNVLLDWLFCAAAPSRSGPSGLNLRRTINVVALDEHGYRGVTWSLKNAMPIAYELSPMDGSRSEVLTESMTFAIDGVERITSPLPNIGTR